MNSPGEAKVIQSTGESNTRIAVGTGVPSAAVERVHEGGKGGDGAGDRGGGGGGLPHQVSELYTGEVLLAQVVAVGNRSSKMRYAIDAASRTRMPHEIFALCPL